MIFGGRAKVTLPNPPPRRWAIAMHGIPREGLAKGERAVAGKPRA